MVRAGLRAMLSIEPDFEIVGEAADGREAVRLCRHLEPDLVLMDRLMPGLDGIAATREIKTQCPRTSVVIITGDPDPASLFDAIKAGAAGYLLKGVSRREVVTTVRRILAGDALLDGPLAAKLLERLAHESNHEDATPATQLTERECAVLRLITQGHTNREIASTLFFSVATVKTHVQHIIRKLGVSDRTQAAVQSIERGLLSQGSV
jgi:DNA-binding NarL/FixJ family response regulator